jgi:hypothetical protein
MATTYGISLSGTIISSSKARSVMGRVSRCSGCGFELSTLMSYQQDKRMWELKHSRQACQERKARIAQLDFTKLGNHIRNQEILNSLN